MRDRIEAALGILGRRIHDHAIWVISVVLLVVGLGASQIPRIELKVAIDEFLREGDPIRVQYDAFLDRFGRDDVMIIAIEPPEVFDLAFLTRLRSLHEALEDGVPHLHDIQSLVNARETRGEDDALIVGELLEDWPESEGALADLRRRALANPLYEGFLLSEGGGLTTITLELEAYSDFYDQGDALAGFDDAPSVVDPAETDTGRGDRLTGAQESEVIEVVNEILDRYRAPDFRIYAGGAPLLNAALMSSLIRDIVVFTLLSIATIAVFLGVVFRRVLGILIPLVVALLSLVATLGAMGSLGIPAMPISEIVPSFLLAVGVGGTVHLLVIFQQRLDAGASREEAIAGALSHSGLPIIMTSLTTAGGLLSFLAAELVPIVVFGTVAPMGIVLTLVTTLLVTPALLALLPFKPAPRAPERGEHVSIRLLTRAGAVSTRRPGRVLGIAVALLLLAVAGMFRLTLSFDSLEWFPDDLPAKVASKKLDADLGGGVALELLIESGRENGLHDPELLRRIDRARHTVADLQVGDVIAGKSVSLVDVVKEIHQALNGGGLEARVLPRDRALVSQELLLFENSGSDDLEDVVDSQFSQARFTMRLPMLDGSQYPPFADEVERIFDEVLEGLADAELTGMMVVMGRSFVASIETLVRSYGIALAVITPLMMLLLGSFRLGLIAMIPNLFPIVLTLGLMGWLGIPIEMFSLLIGSIALGLAVDDTIHFMHGFRRGYARSGDVPDAVRQTLRTTGQALLFTSVVLSVAFFTYVLSDLSNLRSFGQMTAFAILMAFFADVFLAPALMTYTAGWSSVRKPASAASDAATASSR